MFKMGILNLVTDTAGQIGVNPRRVKMITTNNLAAITAAGYLNSGNLEGRAIYATDILDVVYSFNESTNSGIYGEFLPSISNSVITLVQYVSPGDVTLPVVNNNFANYDGTSGKIKDSGYSPTNAAKTKVVMADAAVVSGNLAKYADAAGTVADQGVAFKSVAGAAAAGGAAAQSFTDAFCTSASCVVGNWNTQTNAASVLKIVPGNGSFVVTSSADAGVGTFNYIITK
jgi:hypothetical protein